VKAVRVRHDRTNTRGGYFTSLSHGTTLASTAQEADALLQVLEYPKTAMTLSSLIVVTSTIVGGPGSRPSRPRGTGRGGVRLKCKTSTLWQTGGAHVNMPDYAEMLVSACQSVLLGTEDGSRYTARYDVAHIVTFL
jgi:hypothetical protein